MPHDTVAPPFRTGRGESFTRETVTSSRVMEFFTEVQLAKVIGLGKSRWAAALLVELVANGLDCIETSAASGAGPEIVVQALTDRFSVQDNGLGIPWDVVERSMDYTTLTSDKAHYVSPTRGQQGNALKTAWAGPLVLSGDQRQGTFEVEAHGQRRTYTATLNLIEQRPHFWYDFSPSVVKNGTKITLHGLQLPSSLTATEVVDFYDDDDSDEGLGLTDDEQLGREMRTAQTLLKAFALFNPHTSFTLTGPPEPLEIQACNPGWKKWKPTDGTTAHWYSVEQFANLISVFVREDRSRGRDRSVREFVSGFPGLSGSRKQKDVCDAAGFPPSATLSGLLDKTGQGADLDVVTRLINAMCDSSEPPKHESLGIIGRDVFKKGMIDYFLCSQDTVKYQKATGTTSDGVPWILEVAFGMRLTDNLGRIVVAGMNWAPTLRIPFEGLTTALWESKVYPNHPVVLAAHLVYPGARPTDTAKSRYELPDEINNAMCEAVKLSTTCWTKEIKKEDRTRNRDDKARRTSMMGKKRGEKAEIREAAYRVMEAAYNKASEGIGLAVARQVMYVVREMMQEYTKLCWKDSKYCTQTLIPNFLEKYPDLTASWDVVFDDRGHFSEPHSGPSFGVGTIKVRDYIASWEKGKGGSLGLLEGMSLPRRFPTFGPENRFKFVLFIEKEGFSEILKKAKIADLFDLPIMSTKGMSVTASRQLVDHFSSLGVTTLILHDFDKSGLSILHTIRSNTRRYKFKCQKPLVEDIGLRLADYLEMKETGLILPKEEVVYKKLDSGEFW
jgi:hypothetical protein